MNPDTSTLSQINKVLEVTRKPNKVDIQSINSELVFYTGKCCCE